MYLCLVLNAENQEKNTQVYMASSLSSNGRISAHFGNIYLKFSTYAYFEVHFHPMLSNYQNSKKDFYDIIIFQVILYR